MRARSEIIVTLNSFRQLRLSHRQRVSIVCLSCSGKEFHVHVVASGCLLMQHLTNCRSSFFWKEEINCGFDDNYMRVCCCPDNTQPTVPATQPPAPPQPAPTVTAQLI